MQDIPHSLNQWIDQHIQHKWDPDKIPYVPSQDALSKKTLASLRKLAKTATTVVIASDMDREGEAIAFHLKQLLKLKPSQTRRIVFDQITPQAIHHAMANPTTLREPLYRAQQARRVIDQLFGFKMSPLLWEIQQRLSAGRCQSPALRWLAERQEAFMNVKEVEPKHNIVAELSWLPRAIHNKNDGGCAVDTTVEHTAKYLSSPTSTSSTSSSSSSTSSSSSPPNKHAVLHELQSFRKWVITDDTASQPKQSPPTPFTTSALQQKCYQRFKWAPKTTMRFAQKLYEGGHITYMRTDCKRLSAPFVKEATTYLLDRFGDTYVASPPKTGSTKATKATKATSTTSKAKQPLAQEAHEPIRPTHADRPHLTATERAALAKALKMGASSGGKSGEKSGGKNSAKNNGGQHPDSAAGCVKLYTLIYQTAMSSLMTHCILNKNVYLLHPVVSPARKTTSNTTTKPKPKPKPNTKPQQQQIGNTTVDTAHTLQLEWSGILFPGWRIWEVVDEHPFVPRTPVFAQGDMFQCVEYRSDIHHPIPIKPYTSGDLLKLLETRGVGRPSTYSAILDTLDKRNYVLNHSGEAVREWQSVLEGHPLTKLVNEHVRIDMRSTTPQWTSESKPSDVIKQLQDRYHVTTLGDTVATYLKTHLPDLIDADFTQRMESQLDDITQGKTTYQKVVSEFYHTLESRIQEVRAKLPKKGSSSRTSSPFAQYDNGISKRVLQDNGDHAYVALVTQNGPAVALFYADKARNDAERVFASLPRKYTIRGVDIATAQRLIQEKQKAIANGTDGNAASAAHSVGKHNGIPIYAKSGRFGPYLEWTDPHLNTVQTLSFPQQTVRAEDVTIEQAGEWVDKAKRLVRKVNGTYNIKYNPINDTMFISKKPPGGRGRWLSATIPFQLKDLDKVKRLTVGEVDTLFEAARSGEAKGKTVKAKAPAATSAYSASSSASSSATTVKTVKGKQRKPGKPNKSKAKPAVQKAKPKKRSASRKQPHRKQSQKKTSAT